MKKRFQQDFKILFVSRFFLNIVNSPTKRSRAEIKMKKEKKNQKTWMDNKLIKFILDALQASTIFDNETHIMEV